MDFERVIVPDRDEPIPSNKQSAAADWLREQLDNSERDQQASTLRMVANNGDTALFWYIASLLADYKETQ